MSSSQLYFGLIVGLIVMAVGAGAIQLGAPGGAMIMVGAAIALVTLWSWRATDSASNSSIELQARMLPATASTSPQASK